MYLWFTFSPRKQTRCDLVITQRGKLIFKIRKFCSSCIAIRNYFLNFALLIGKVFCYGNLAKNIV